MSQIKQPAIQVVANEINSIDTESNIPAIKAMVDLDRRIRESILEKKYDKIKEQTINMNIIVCLFVFNDISVICQSQRGCEHYVGVNNN